MICERSGLNSQGTGLGTVLLCCQATLFYFAAGVELSGLSVVLLMPVECGLSDHATNHHKLPGEENCCNSVSYP